MQWITAGQVNLLGTSPVNQEDPRSAWCAQLLSVAKFFLARQEARKIAQIIGPVHTLVTWGGIQSKPSHLDGDSAHL